MSLSIGNRVIKVAANGMNNIAHSSAATKLADWGTRMSSKKDIFGKPLTNFDAKMIPALAVVLPIWLSSFYIYNNLTSKKIPQERKIPLAINDMVITLFSGAAGLTVSRMFNACQAGMIERLNKVVLNPDKAKMLAGGIKQMMAITAFTLVFRYLGPVVATPLADKITKLLVKCHVIKDPELVKKEREAKEAKQNNNPFTPPATSSPAFMASLNNHKQQSTKSFIA